MEIQKLKENLDEERNGLKLYQGDFLKQRNQLQLELQTVKQEKTDLQITIFELENSKHELENNIVELEKQLNECMQNYNEISSQNNRLAEDKHELSKQLKCSNDDNMILAEKVNDLREKIKGYVLSCEDLRNDNKFLQEEVKDKLKLKKQYSDLKSLSSDLDKRTQNLNKYF